MTPIPRLEPRPGRLKRCSRCRLWLPVSQSFTRDRACPDGYRGECSDCRRERRRALEHGARRCRPWCLSGSVAEKARARGFVPNTVRERVRRGWSLRKALLRPV